MRWSALLLAISGGLWAAEVNLEWDPVGDTRVTGYELGWGAESGVYTGLRSAGETTATLDLAEPGPWYIAARTVGVEDGAQIVSVWSDEVIWVAQATGPTQPGDQTGVWAYYEDVTQVAISHIATGIFLATGAGAGGYSTSADPIDTTGADLLVIVIDSYQIPASGWNSTYVTDSKGNTWTFLKPGSTDLFASRIAYCLNPTSTGSGHYASVGANSGITYASMAFIAFSGVDAFYEYTASETTTTPGSITPSESGQLFVTGVGGGSGSDPSLGGDFTDVLNKAFVGGVAAGAGVAYYISPNTNAVNPTWANGGADTGSIMAAFTPAAGGPSSNLPAITYHRSQHGMH